MQSTVWKLTSLTVVVAIGLIGVFQAQKFFPASASKETPAASVAESTPATPAQEDEPDPFSSPSEASPPRKLKTAAQSGGDAEQAPIKDVIGDENPFADEKPAKIVASSHQKKESPPTLAETEEEPSAARKNEDPAETGPALMAAPEEPSLRKSKNTPQEKSLASAAKKLEEAAEESRAEPEPAYNPFDKGAKDADKKSADKKSNEEAKLKPEDAESAQVEEKKPEEPADSKLDLVADDADFPEAVSPEKLLTQGKKKENSGPTLMPAAAKEEHADLKQREEEKSKADHAEENRPSLLAGEKTAKSAPPELERTRPSEEPAPLALSPESPRTPDALPAMAGGKKTQATVTPPAVLPPASETPSPAPAKNAPKSDKGKRPELTIDKQAPETATLGQKMVYTILVKNVSDIPAHQVVVQDEIPVGLELDGTIPRAEMSGRKLIWRIGLLGPGEERLIKARVTPMQEGDLGSVATVNFLAEPPKQPSITSTPVIRPSARNVPESVLELDVDQPREVPAGAPFKIKFKITNVGKMKVTNIALRGILHPLVKHKEIAERELDCPISDLNPGQSFSVDLELVGIRAGNSFNKIQLLVNQQRVRESELEIRVNDAK